LIAMTLKTMHLTFAAASLAAALLQPGMTQPAFANPGKPQAARAAAVPAYPALRADVTATREILTLGDLVANLPASVASQPAFRAPALGETGTIQATRIFEAARAQGVDVIADGGAAQVVVTRAARRIGMVDIEAAVRRAVEERHGVDARALTISLDNGAPSLAVEPELRGELQTQDIVYDARSRRFSATLTLPGSAALRLKPVRIAGQMVETVEVVVPLRAINRGDILQAADIMIERRPRETAAPDIVVETTAAIGKAARRNLSAGQLLRAGDLQRQEMVARNEVITIIYEAPGLSLTMRARAQEGGAQGDIISVMNLQSKKVLQGVVIGQGRVAVNGAPAGRVAAAN
jgi:flagella basal body P-ring formation protein FlgA